MGIRRWFGRQVLNAAADELQKGNTMSPGFKAMLELTAWTVVGTFLGSLSSIFMSGRVPTNEEVIAALGGALGAVGALFRNKPTFKE